jgi:ribosomal-protein-serine acetyltransferase
LGFYLEVNMQSITVSNEILLERLSDADTVVIFETIEANKDWLAKWLPFVRYTNELKDTSAFITSVIEKRDETGNEVYVIWYKGDFAGLISFLNTDKVNEKTELGYWLVEQFTGKGIITSCAQAMLQLAFEKMMMNRVTIRCAIDNTPSENVALRLGFKFEGVERQGERYRDQHFDLKVFSLLKSEYPAS